MGAEAVAGRGVLQLGECGCRPRSSTRILLFLRLVVAKGGYTASAAAAAAAAEQGCCRCRRYRGGVVGWSEACCLEDDPAVIVPVYGYKSRYWLCRGRQLLLLAAVARGGRCLFAAAVSFFDDTATNGCRRQVFIRRRGDI